MAVPVGIKYQGVYKGRSDGQYSNNKNHDFIIHDNSSFCISKLDGTGVRYYGSLKAFFASWKDVNECKEQ